MTLEGIDLILRNISKVKDILESDVADDDKLASLKLIDFSTHSYIDNFTNTVNSTSYIDSKISDFSALAKTVSGLTNQKDTQVGASVLFWGFWALDYNFTVDWLTFTVDQSVFDSSVNGLKTAFYWGGNFSTNRDAMHFQIFEGYQSQNDNNKNLLTQKFLNSIPLEKIVNLLNEYCDKNEKYEIVLEKLPSGKTIKYCKKK